MLHSKYSIGIILILNWLIVDLSYGKSIDRCELVHEFKRFRPQISYQELNAWVCIANYQSYFNTSHRNSDVNGVEYHGIFQIGDKYWCSRAIHDERSCKLKCDQLYDTDFKDDFDCLDKIYAENLRINGNGFAAWPIYATHCNNNRDLIKDCLNVAEKKFFSTNSFGENGVSKYNSKNKVDKIYERCELARELYFVHGFPFEQIATWICITKFKSNFNTSALAVNPSGSIDNGLFQINNNWWCSLQGNGLKCEINCAKLRDSNITDDAKCAQIIYNEHQRIRGDGFTAWNVYKKHCATDTDHFITGCFNRNEIQSATSSPSISTTITTTTKRTNAQLILQSGKVYKRCELAQELRYKHNIPKDQIHTWICIAKSLSNFDTAAESSKDFQGKSSHGLFQINENYWCSQNGNGGGCNVNCANLRNSDITDDLECVQNIFNEHERIFGNGFHAWPVYESRCKYETTASTQECFDNEIDKFDAPISIKQPKQNGKIYERCELAKELRYVHNVPYDQIPKWVCIAQYHSNLATSTIRFTEHGIFQINEEYWCSMYGSGKGCDLPCSALHDSNIADDVKCAMKIFNEHAKYFGDGFKAWSAYEPYCKDQTQFTGDCFSDVSPKSSIFSFTGKSPVSIQTTFKAKEKGKIYGRCELAKKLFDLGMPKDQIPTWVCIAKHESNFDTSAVGRLNADGSGDHGIFQISDLFWCSLSGYGKGCFTKCSKFEDSDISDDVECVKKIFDEHQRLFGNGFHAWSVYERHCKYSMHQYVSDCFSSDQDINSVSIAKPINVFTTSRPITTAKPINAGNSINEYGRAYERCELAEELRYQHNIPNDEISDWVCIALYESNLVTSAKGVREHGLFQISGDYWCSNDGSNGMGCNIECSKFQDSDITDDIACARKIYNAHKQFSSSGFLAWNVYEPYCKGRSSDLIAGCFNDILISNAPATDLDSNRNDINNSILDSIESSDVTSSEFAKKGKRYERCELARELRYKYNLDQVHTWVCIAQRESNFDTSAVGRLNADGSGDHGLFQISDIYWCSATGQNDKACGVPCSNFEDADISDDVKCVQKIYDEHQRLFGNGFHAWTTYEPYCKSVSSLSIDHCFSSTENTTPRFNQTIFETSTKPFGQNVIFTQRPPEFINKLTKSHSQYSFKPFALTAIKTSTSMSTTTAPKQFSTTSNILSFQPFNLFSSSTENSFSTAETTPPATKKFNIFDLYLNQYKTKQPQRYIIPQFNAFANKPIALAEQSIQSTSTVTFNKPVNFISTTPALKISTTTSTKKPQNNNYQEFFSAQIAKVVKLAPSNATVFSFSQPTNFSYRFPAFNITTTKKPYIFRYSFSGTTKPPLN